MKSEAFFSSPCWQCLHFESNRCTTGVDIQQTNCQGKKGSLALSVRLHLGVNSYTRL
ncbi:hypothetical protein ACE6H2_009074 [Prunus campanulata]